MNTHEEFLQMITENPDDLQTRLVYADWLREDGRTVAEQERGEFIWKSVTGVADASELQVKYEKMPHCYDLRGLPFNGNIRRYHLSDGDIVHAFDLEGSLQVSQATDELLPTHKLVEIVISNGFLEKITFTGEMSPGFIDAIPEDIVFRSPLRAIQYVVDEHTSHTIAIRPREVGWRKRAKFIIAATLENGQSTSVGGLYFRSTQ